MPEEHNSIFAKWKGTEHWSNAMFEKRSDEVLVTVEYPDGTRVTEATYTIDGKWKMIAKVLGGTVIAWKPFLNRIRRIDKMSRISTNPF